MLSISKYIRLEIGWGTMGIFKAREDGCRIGILAKNKAISITPLGYLQTGVNMVFFSSIICQQLLIQKL